MRHTIFIIALSTFFTTDVNSQILQKTIAKFESFKNLSYTTILKKNDLFSEAVLNDTILAEFDLSNNRNLFKITNDKTKEWYDGNKLIRFNLEDSTYRIFNSNQKSIFENKSLPEIIKSLAKDLQKKAPIKKIKDSVIGRKSYYQFAVREYDSLKNGKRVFLFKKILIDKITFLPFFYRIDQQGFIDGTNALVEIFYEHRFENYQVNSKEIPDLTMIQIQSNFVLEKPEKVLPFLTKGTPAPEIELFDSLGSPFRLKNQKGKIVLLNFAINGCPHCAESIGMLNELYSRFKNNGFTIITINPFDNDESIKKYYIKFDIKYPLFKNPPNGKTITDNYHLYSSPTFYLIDKNGDVVKGFSGYSKTIDQELAQLIKEYL